MLLLLPALLPLLLGLGLLLLGLSAPLLVVGLLHSGQGDVVELLEGQVKQLLEDSADLVDQPVPLLSRDGLQQQLLAYLPGYLLEQFGEVVGEELLVDLGGGVVAFAGEVGDEELLDALAGVPAVDLDESVDVVGVDLLGVEAEEVDGPVRGLAQLVVVPQQLLQQLRLRLLVLVLDDHRHQQLLLLRRAAQHQLHHVQPLREVHQVLLAAHHRQQLLEDAPRRPRQLLVAQVPAVAEVPHHVLEEEEVGHAHALQRALVPLLEALQLLLRVQDESQHLVLLLPHPLLPRLLLLVALQLAHRAQLPHPDEELEEELEEGEAVVGLGEHRLDEFLDVAVLAVLLGLPEFEVEGDDLEGHPEADLVHVVGQLPEHLVDDAGLPVVLLALVGPDVLEGFCHEGLAGEGGGVDDEGDGDVFGAAEEVAEEDAVEVDDREVDEGLRVLADDGRELDDRGGQLVDADALLDVRLVLQELAQHLDLGHCVARALRPAAVLADQPAQLLEELGDLEAVDPLLEEAGVLVLELGAGGAGVAEVGGHEFVHDEAVDLVALRLLVVDVVESEADVRVVEADLLVEREVEDVEVDHQRDLGHLQQVEDVILLDRQLLHLLRLLGDADAVVVAQHVRHLAQGEAALLVLLEVGAHLQALPPVDRLPVDPPHPLLAQVLLEVELDHAVLHQLPVLEPPELNPHLLLLAEAQVLHDVALLVLGRLLELQPRLQRLHVEDAGLQVAGQHFGQVEVLLLAAAGLQEEQDHLQVLAPAHAPHLQPALRVGHHLARQLVLAEGADHAEEGLLDLVADVVGDLDEVVDGDVEEEVGREEPVGVLEGEVDALEQVDHAQVDAVHLQPAQRERLLALLLDAHQQVHQSVRAPRPQQVPAAREHLAPAPRLRLGEQRALAQQVLGGPDVVLDDVEGELLDAGRVPALLEGQQVELERLHEGHHFLLLLGCAEHADEDLLQLLVVLEHAVRLQVLQVQTREDVLVVGAVLLQADAVEVQPLQAVDEVPLLLLLHPALLGQRPGQADRLHQQQALLPLLQPLPLHLALDLLVDLPQVEVALEQVAQDVEVVAVAAAQRDLVGAGCVDQVRLRAQDVPEQPGVDHEAVDARDHFEDAVLEVELARVVDLQSLVQDDLQVPQQLPQLALQLPCSPQLLRVELALLPPVGQRPEERLELLGELGEAVPEDVDEGVGADDGDCPELVDGSRVGQLAGEVGQVLVGGEGQLAVADGVVPGEEQVDGLGEEVVVLEGLLLLLVLLEGHSVGLR